MKTILLLSVLLLFYCIPGFTQQIFSQTKTANFLNNLNDFQDAYGDINYPRNPATDVAVDDDIFASTSRLGSEVDSNSTFSLRRSVSVLALQGFGFTIPPEATILDIEIRLRRFASGRSATVGDLQLSLMQSFGGLISSYGVFWTYQDDYPGKVYPATETEYHFFQQGNENNGGFFHDQAYQWTPAIVNHQFFGVRIENYIPIGRGPVVINYDLVDVKVNYSLPSTLASQSVLETNPWKQPAVYPNPFTTSATMQFTAVETGNAVVDLYNILGVKVRNIFTGKVEKGQVYTATAEGSLLTKGIYIYRIQNGKYSYAGKLLKVDK